MLARLGDVYTLFCLFVPFVAAMFPLDMVMKLLRVVHNAHYLDGVQAVHKQRRSHGADKCMQTLTSESDSSRVQSV